MEIVEVINQLNWPGAVAIVGSVVTVVLGWLRLRTMREKTPEENPAQAVHDRVSSLKDVVSDLDGDFKAVLARLNAVERSLTDHEARDAADFKALSDKVDKIMEIIVEMLKDAQ